MARRYVRDKIGRFAAKGGGGKRAGKLSKSTGRGRSAKAAYHDAKSDLRFEKRVGPASGTKNTRAIRKSQKKLTTLSNQMTGKGKAAGSGIKKGLRSQTASRRKQAFRSKATKGRAARAEYKAASRKDRKIRDDAARKKVIKKQTGKPAYRDNTGYFSPQRTKQPRAGSRTKAQRLKDKIESRKNTNKWMRGSEFKGPKKGTAKQVAAGKKRSAKAKATKAAARKANFKGKATQGRAAKAKYKSAASKLRKKTSGVGINTAKGSKSHKKQVSTAKGQLTRVTNKLTAKGAAKAKISPKRAKAQQRATQLGLEKPLLRKSLASQKKAKATRAKTAERKAAAKAKKSAPKKAATKAPSAFGKTAKYTRQGKVSKASGAGRAAKAKYKKVKTKAAEAKRWGRYSTGKEARAYGRDKAALTRLKKNKGATQGKGYGISEKGKAARQRFTQLKRERGGATKGRGTAAQKMAGMSYRRTMADLGYKTKGRVPKGPSLGIKSRAQYLKEMPRKQSWEGKGSKAKRRMQNIKGRKG